MKVLLLDCRLFSKKPTGISRFTDELIKYFVNKNNIKLVVLIYPWQKSLFLKYHQITTNSSPFRIWDILKLSLKLSFHNIDFLFSPFYSSVFFNFKFKKISCVMDLTYKMLPCYFSNNKFINYSKVLYLDFIVFFSLNNSYKIYSISKSTINDLLNCFGYYSKLLYLGTNKLSSTSSPKQAFDVIPNEYYLYVGNNRINKNLDFLVSVYLNSKSNKKLVIAGCNIDAYHSIINIVDPSDSDLYYLYENCFCFVFPSTYEGFGLPVLEALNFNKPILLSRTSSLLEFSVFNLNYFCPHKPIELSSYFNDDTLLLLPENLHMLSQFSWKNMSLTLNNTLFIQ